MREYGHQIAEGRVGPRPDSPPISDGGTGESHDQGGDDHRESGAGPGTELGPSGAVATLSLVSPRTSSVHSPALSCSPRSVVDSQPQDGASPASSSPRGSGPPTPRPRTYSEVPSTRIGVMPPKPPGRGASKFVANKRSSVGAAAGSRMVTSSRASGRTSGHASGNALTRELHQHQFLAVSLQSSSSRGQSAASSACSSPLAPSPAAPTSTAATPTSDRTAATGADFPTAAALGVSQASSAAAAPADPPFHVELEHMDEADTEADGYAQDEWVVEE